MSPLPWPPMAGRVLAGAEFALDLTRNIFYTLGQFVHAQGDGMKISLRYHKHFDVEWPAAHAKSVDGIA